MIEAESREQLCRVGERTKLDQIVGADRVGAGAADANSVPAVMLLAEENCISADAAIGDAARLATAAGTSVGTVYSFTFGAHSTSFPTSLPSPRRRATLEA